MFLLMCSLKKAVSLHHKGRRKLVLFHTKIAKLILLRARQQPMRNPPIEIDAAEKYPHDKTEKQERKQANTIFNEVRQFAYVLGARGREILLIQQSITTCSLLQEIFKGDFSSGFNS